jgi:SAM-dependent methyltransferase
MSQVYGKEIARIYNQMWGSFAIEAASHIMDFYQGKEIYKSNKNVLDICCGTGQLLLEFLKNDYHVTGIDLSPYMISYARENTKEYEAKGAVNFVETDVSNFHLKKEYGLAVSTYDSINHLENKKALMGCFGSVYQCVIGGGYFIFDLNTKEGLKRWNSTHIEDKENILLIIKGIFDTKSDKAVTRISGFIKEKDGRYSRFEEIVYNYFYWLTDIKKMLHKIGWTQVDFVRIEDLNKNMVNPEDEDRVFIVAKK